MPTTADATLAEAGLDGVAVKPAEVAVERAANLDVETVAVDYEGREHVPDPETLVGLGAEKTVWLTTPVRADGYDPRGDDSLVERVPEAVGRAVVAGNPAYLDDAERSRAVAPRLSAAADRADDPWVGTEGVERVALAVGGTQYELLGPSTVGEMRGLRAAGFEEEVVLYAPVVLAEEDDVVLDAVGDYVARRGPVRRALPGEAATDRTASGSARETLLRAARDFALAGDVETVRERVEELREAGVDTIVGYPAQGLDAVR